MGGKWLRGPIFPAHFLSESLFKHFFNLFLREASGIFSTFLAVYQSEFEVKLELVLWGRTQSPQYPVTAISAPFLKLKMIVAGGGNQLEVLGEEGQEQADQNSK